MRILRDIQPVAKVTAVFILALSTATIFTLVSPRAAHAEGFLLPTVRCVVQTVLVDGCQPSSQAPAQDAPTQQNQAASSTQSSSTSSQQSSGAPKQSTPVSGSYFEPIPESGGGSLPEIKEAPSTQLSNVSHIDESEYVAYFNAYSKYAVQRAQAAPFGGEVLQAGPEGWKVMGIAWYWWLLGLSAPVAVGWYLMTKYRRPLMK